MRLRPERAFTLIELLVTLSIIALLLSIVGPRYFSSVSKAEETTLKSDLAVLRDAIDKHYADFGKYPASLQELAQRKYIRAVPDDPITRSNATWVTVPPADPSQGGVYDVHSGAQGTGRNGKPYAEW